MNVYFWLVMAGFVAMIAGTIWYVRRKAEERRVSEEARVAAFMSGLPGAPKPAPVDPAIVTVATAAPSAPSAPAPANDLALQKLLFDAAHKAGEAGEPALSVQLYARLLARYPATSFAAPARAAVETQKRRLLKER